MIRFMAVVLLSGTIFGLYFSLLILQKFSLAEAQNMITGLLYICVVVIIVVTIVSFIELVHDLRQKGKRLEG